MRLRRRYRLGAVVADADLEDIVAEEGLQIVEWPFVGRVVEVLHGRRLGLRVGLARAQRRWLIAHGLGHHLLHTGNHLETEDWLWAYHQERQANLFAGWLHLGGIRWRCECWELAEYCVLPEGDVRAWFELVEASGCSRWPARHSLLSQ